MKTLIKIHPGQSHGPDQSPWRRLSIVKVRQDRPRDLRAAEADVTRVRNRAPDQAHEVTKVAGLPPSVADLGVEIRAPKRSIPDAGRRPVRDHLGRDRILQSDRENKREADQGLFKFCVRQRPVR